MAPLHSGECGLVQEVSTQTATAWFHVVALAVSQICQVASKMPRGRLSPASLGLSRCIPGRRLSAMAVSATAVHIYFLRAFFLPFFLPAFFLARFLAMGHDLLERGERVGDACTNVRGRNVRHEIVVSSSVVREKSLDRKFFKFFVSTP